ncbi:hypothetical protein DAPK24_048410 [Pichia kluyveri]|uniref:Uncharacterized protein n=1 Tax=Pichia kluyveri TaxID=36015 RepID=A0AAV5R9Z3_PICKL|nr:hypothetical protein DAPK24_048410 [Pichia kluyveri]
MPGPLLPFAFDKSRIDEHVPPLEVLSSQNLNKNKRKDIFNNDDFDNDDNNDDDNDHNINAPANMKRNRSEYNNEYNNEIDNYNNNNNNINYNNNEYPSHNRISSSIPEKKGKFYYSALNSSSSVLQENSLIVNNNYNENNTSSTAMNDPTNDDLINSDPINQLNFDVPSSPIIESQSDFFNKHDHLRSDAFDDMVSFNNGNNTEIKLKPTIPSSPTLLPLSPTQINSQSKNEFKFHRPNLKKSIHPLSRHGSTFNEQPTRKKQRMIVSYDDYNLRSLKRSNSSILIKPKDDYIIDFAIDRDGHVFGYNLENDELPSNYSPTLYDEPNYFVVKNSSKGESNLNKAIENFFDQPINPTNPILTLNLHDLKLNSLSESISDIENYIDCTNDGIIKPVIYIDASNNNLRSINPKIFLIERLEMLTLRNNKIARLSGNIEKAIYLKSLNLGMNKFKFLPHNILNLPKLEVLAITGNQLIPFTSVDKFYSVNENLLRLYSNEFKTNYFLSNDKQIKFFSRIHWLRSNKQISKRSVQASLLSRSLTTLQDMCYDNNESFNDWNNNKIDMDESDNKLKYRLEKQSYIESRIPFVPKLSELALRQISKYLISESEILNWKESTNEFIYKRAMNSLISGTNGETCGSCNNPCIESVADILEWWDLKGSKSVTIKRRFCSKKCAKSWIEKLNKFKCND